MLWKIEWAGVASRKWRAAVLSLTGNNPTIAVQIGLKRGRKRGRKSAEEGEAEEEARDKYLCHRFLGTHYHERKV